MGTWKGLDLSRGDDARVQIGRMSRHQAGKGNMVSEF